MNYLYNSETIYRIPETIKMDGPNAQHPVIIICRKLDLADGGIELLGQIMGALNWKKGEDYSIVELEHDQQIALTSCLHSDHRLIFSFGLEEKELSIQASSSYYIKARFENATLIRSHSIKELKQNKDHKGSLWATIKEYKK